MGTLMRFIGLYCVVSLLCWAQFIVYGYRPHSWAEAAVSFAVALPATLAMEWLGTTLFARNPLARAVEARTAGKRFSWLRVVFALTVTLAAVVVATLMYLLVRRFVP